MLHCKRLRQSEAKWGYGIVGSDDQRAGPREAGRKDFPVQEEGSGAAALSSRRDSLSFQPTSNLFRKDQRALRRFQAAAAGGVVLKKLRPSDEITPVSAPPEKLPLTIAQRGIWIGSKISRAGTIFNIAEALEIRGGVDAPRDLEPVHLW